MANSAQSDGGSNALRGFIYQFDSSLIEIFDYPTRSIGIEQVQDINHDGYYIQVKYRSQKFIPSAIRSAVAQLINEWLVSPNGHFTLHLHFKNEGERVWFPSISELNKILGNRKKEFSLANRKKFLERFQIKFGVDFVSQFKVLISKIANTYGVTEEEAVCYHAIFQTYLLKIAVRTRKSDRVVSKELLDSIIAKTQEIIFYTGHEKFLGKKKYLDLLRRSYFTFKQSNIENFERVFIVECDQLSQSRIVQIIIQIRNRYYRADKSPAPYIFLRNCRALADIKKSLIDKGLMFFDGTYFNGDKFRLRSLIQKRSGDERFKLVDQENLNSVIKALRPDEIFEFFYTNPMSFAAHPSAYRLTIKINSTADILQVIK